MVELARGTRRWLVDELTDETVAHEMMFMGLRDVEEQPTFFWVSGSGSSGAQGVEVRSATVRVNGVQLPVAVVRVDDPAQPRMTSGVPADARRIELPDGLTPRFVRSLDVDRLLEHLGWLERTEDREAAPGDLVSVLRAVEQLSTDVQGLSARVTASEQGGRAGPRGGGRLSLGLGGADAADPMEAQLRALEQRVGGGAGREARLRHSNCRKFS